MAIGKIAVNRKAVSNPASKPLAGTAKSAERPNISKGIRGTSRIRYDMRMPNPRGWRASFMSL
jgi:hypothetical protein